MDDLKLNLTDDERYRPFALIRRLLTEQGFAHWRKYAVAFVFMAISAACTALSAYLIGDVINQTYVNHNLTGVIVLGSVTAALFAAKG
ncbi:MAG: ABC transporter ATP-binding protein, partial [Pseudolabrys sp.]